MTTSLHHTFIPVYQDAEHSEIHSCVFDGKDYDESDMVKDDNGVKPVWIHKNNIEAYIEKMTKELELNEPYKF